MSFSLFQYEPTDPQSFSTAYEKYENCKSVVQAKILNEEEDNAWQMVTVLGRFTSAHFGNLAKTKHSRIESLHRSRRPFRGGGVPCCK